MMPESHAAVYYSNEDFYLHEERCQKLHPDPASKKILIEYEIIYLGMV